jgi:hypothetical protein
MEEDPRLCHWKRSSAPSVRGPIIACARALPGCKKRDSVLIKRRGEMQVSNPARISRAISQWRYTGDRFCNTGML